HYRTQGLHLKNRSEGCILGGPNAYSISTISNIPKQEYSLPIQVTGFWLEHRPTCLLKGHAISYRPFKKRRYKTNILSRRYMHFSKNKKSNGNSHRKNANSPTESWIHHQLQKTQPEPITNTGLPRLSIQQCEDDHFGTSTEDTQIESEIETSTTVNHKNMQMDSGITGENNINSTSHWRSTISHPVLTERSLNQPEQEQHELGKLMLPVSLQQERAEMVDGEHHQKEWIANPDDYIAESSNSNTCRGIRHRLRNTFT
ncbi:hypothetical protein BDB01DRAFT_813412, partial [Pilobolus umbonatus]